MKRKFFLCLFMAILFPRMAFAWPWDPKPKLPQPQSSDSRDSADTETQADLEPLTGKTEESTDTTDQTKVWDVKRTGKKKISDAEMGKLKEKIQQVIHANAFVKAQNVAQAAEIQRIIEQARVHEQILKSLENSPRNKIYKANDANELLRQEKIRLIQEQTLRNINVIQSFNPPPAVSSGPASVQAVQDLQRAQQMQRTQEIIRTIDQTKNSH